MKKLYVVVLLALVLSLFVACSGDDAAPVSMDEAALKVTGSVNGEVGWSDKQLRAMDSMTVEKENKEGVVEEFTGVSLNTLLDKAGVNADAATLAFVGADGYVGEADLAEVLACTDCIVAFQDDGEGFDMVLPGFSGKANVRDVVEITVQ